MTDPLPSIHSLKKGYEKLNKARKNHVKLLLVILSVSMGLVVYLIPQRDAYAQKTDALALLTPEAIDPLDKIGKGLKSAESNNFSKQGVLEKKEAEEVSDNPKFSEMLDGFPMEKMIPALSKRNLEVSSYLIAIAKKESDWGKHSPKRAGRECYNYWGYKGSYHQTASGYSCFDSPEHAISVVGDRIEALLNKKVNTPAKFVVWKCGSSCAGHNPGDVQKWIQDVAMYYRKLNT